MPQPSTVFTTSARRLLWWLVAGLLLLGIASVTASTLVASRIESWLRQRGLDAQIEYLQVSIPDLRLLARGVRINNAQGRGLRARELLLDYSWWQLLLGEVRLQRVSVDGLRLDLESSAAEGGRQWEIGGWMLAPGQRRDRDFALWLDRLRIRDSRICYRHRPAWAEADCVDLGGLRARDFRLGMQRRGDEPLQLTIDADRLRLERLRIGKKAAPEADLTLAQLALSDAGFVRPGNRVTADVLTVREFAGCPPDRWARALPALGRLMGHCGAARQLQLSGDLLFSFGRDAEVRWHRASGQEVALRYRDNRWHNWRAQTLALADFRYLRRQKKLGWQSAGASAFDWCPKGLRNTQQHYCLRAGTLELPRPVQFDWSGKLKVTTGRGLLRQTQLLDLAGANPNPLTAHLTRLEALQYDGATRRMTLTGLRLASASGCIPGQLWGEPDYCLRLAGVHTGAPLEIRFAARARQLPWGFASGPLTIGQFSASRGGRPQLQLRGLHWRKLSLMGGEAPLLAQDFGLESLSGCLPARLLPAQLRDRLQPLCAELENLRGRGHFAWSGTDGYLLAGELRLDRLLLSDQRGGDRGLLLRKLHTGALEFHRNASAVPARRNGVSAARRAAREDIGTEKGLLPDELARRRREESTAGPPARAGPNLLLRSASLLSLQGCLPRAWARLVYEKPQQMPTCFELLDLEQRGPLALSWQAGLELVVSGLSLQKAVAKTYAGERLLALSGLQLPSARILHPRAGSGAEFALAQFSLDELHFCLPGAAAPGQPRCLSTSKVRALEESGLALGETLLRVSPDAEPLWRIESARVARLALTSQALELTGVRLRALRVCGPLAHLAQVSEVADCIGVSELFFTGHNRIVLKPKLRLELGELRARSIALWPRKGDEAPLGLQRLSWKKLRWDGGRILRTTDLRLSGLHVCLGGETSCANLGSLSLPGRQRLSLAAPYSTDGVIELADLSIGGQSGEPWRIARLTLHDFSWGGGAGVAGSVSAAAGCLPAGALADTRLAPCYRFGRVHLGKVEFIETAAGRVTLLRGFSIDGLAVEQAGYPDGLAAPLLRLETIGADQLRFGAGRIAARGLQVSGLASCVPPGYVERLHHCVMVEQLLVSGDYRARDRSLSLSRLQLHGIALNASDGRELLTGESAAFEQLLLTSDLWGFQRFEAGKFALFKRGEQAPEYHRHSWAGRWAGLQVEQLRFDRNQHSLEIARVDALRPRLIVTRNRVGDYPLLGRWARLTGTPGSKVAPVVEIAGKKLRYHIRTLDLRHATFTWVDRREEYRARLPIRAIYLTMHNISNHPRHPAAVVLLNGRPGGFGEIQLAGTIDYLETRKWNANLTGYIINTNLIPATSYMARLLGYKILQGQLDARLDIRIRENQVSAFADMELNKIRVRRVRKEDQLPVGSSVIPLGIALRLLRDGDGNVHIRMPVSGTLHDPDFSVSYIFSDLLQQAILETLFSYFTPIGFYTLAEYAWARFRAIDFDPIAFPPGSDQLGAEALAQLNQMLATLREHPDARPGICGIANARDWYALHPRSTPGLGGSRRAREGFYRHPPLALLEEFERLALRRSRQVERFLIDAGITASELIPCAPDYNGRDFGAPRVEFSN